LSVPMSATPLKPNELWNQEQEIKSQATTPASASSRKQKESAVQANTPTESSPHALHFQQEEERKQKATTPASASSSPKDHASSSSQVTPAAGMPSLRQPSSTGPEASSSQVTPAPSFRQATAMTTDDRRSSFGSVAPSVRQASTVMSEEVKEGRASRLESTVEKENSALGSPVVMEEVAGGSSQKHGSRSSSESQSSSPCRMSATQNAAEVLSALATSAGGRWGGEHEPESPPAIT
jgi:hypothetical protein